jgi:hypothetical protein
VIENNKLILRKKFHKNSILSETILCYFLNNNSNLRIIKLNFMFLGKIEENLGFIEFIGT